MKKTIKCNIIVRFADEEKEMSEQEIKKLGEQIENQLVDWLERILLKYGK